MGYDVRTLKAFTYENRQDPLEVYTLVFDEESEAALKKKKPHSELTFDSSGKSAPPTRNYLDTIIRGASDLGLEQEYIDFLNHFEAIPISEYNPSDQNLEDIHRKVWSLDEVEAYIAENPLKCVYIFKGIVLDEVKANAGWRR